MISEQLEAEAGAVLPARETLARISVITQFTFVSAPSLAVVSISRGSGNNAVALAGSTISITQTAIQG